MEHSWAQQTSANNGIRKKDHYLQVIGDLYQNTSESSKCFYKTVSLKNSKVNVAPNYWKTVNRDDVHC